MLNRTTTLWSFIILVVIFLLVMAAMVNVYAPANQTTSTYNQIQQSESQQRVDQRNQSTIYYQDPRTMICFALYDGNVNKDFTSVPCNMVPAKLLLIANIK